MLVCGFPPAAPSWLDAGECRRPVHSGLGGPAGGRGQQVVDVDERAVEEVKLQVQLQKEERPGTERSEG